MSSRRLLDIALASTDKNPQQRTAIEERGHCVVLAGPGSGKTKTLTTAMARALIEDVQEPRGIACITYNNECALELEQRLELLGIEPNYRIFIGTVHSFALTQIIYPYARCVMPKISKELRPATIKECEAARDAAYKEVIGNSGNPSTVWRNARFKRLRIVDRAHENWRGQSPKLTALIECYEKILRKSGLIDFDDMPLIAARMVQKFEWIRYALFSKYPVLFVDEYQDLGDALHKLVCLLCFESGARLFAVGDPDQSIYGFNGANPSLLKSLAEMRDVKTIKLELNYRCGTRIIDASKAALGEERNYSAPDGTAPGEVFFRWANGDLKVQAEQIVKIIIPEILSKGVKLEQIAVLYRNAQEGTIIANAANSQGIPIIRADNQSLVPRSSRISRFVESCAKWAVGGWKRSSPKFGKLLDESVNLVYGANAHEDERRQVERELISFLLRPIEMTDSTHEWLQNFRDQVISPWQYRLRNLTDDWQSIEKMITHTTPTESENLSLGHFSGQLHNEGRLNLSTLHSSKGREFDAVILFGMNKGDMPTNSEIQDAEKLKEARRLFYVGVTRAKKFLYIVFKARSSSPWVKELFDKLEPQKK